MFGSTATQCMFSLLCGLTDSLLPYVSTATLMAQCTRNHTYPHATAHACADLRWPPTTCYPVVYCARYRGLLLHRHHAARSYYCSCRGTRLPPLTQMRRTRYASQRCATTGTALILYCDDTGCLCSGSLSTGLAKYKNKYKYKTHKIAQRALLAWSRTCARDALTNIR